MSSLPRDFFDPPRVYHVYAPDGTYKGKERLTYASRERYEAKGFTFKRVWPLGYQRSSHER